MIDFQTLVGDAVDNVPGVEKVGPKTAAKWLNEYGSLDALVARAGEIKGVAGENLRKALDWLPTGRQLLTIKTDCDLNGFVPGLPSLESIRVGQADAEALKAFYERYGFKGLAARAGEKLAAASPAAEPGLFDEPVAPPAPARELRYDTILTWEALDAWLVACRRPSWWHSTPRPPRWTRCARPSSAFPSAWSRVRRPMYRWPTKARMRPNSCRWTRCCSA